MESEHRSMEPEVTLRTPRRVNVDSYGSYAEAQGVVNHLSDARFPVKRISIVVAEDLRLVEQMTGRKGYGQAALQGAGGDPRVVSFLQRLTLQTQLSS